jgi:hypothetical protein
MKYGTQRFGRATAGASVYETPGWRRLIRATKSAGLALLLAAAGCAGPRGGDGPDAWLEQAVRSIPDAADVAWVRAVLAEHSGDRLITVFTTPEWQTLVVLERWVDVGGVRCLVHKIEVDEASGTLVRSTEQAYQLDDKTAIAVFENLYEQVACGHRYQPRDRKVNPPWGRYLIATGRKRGMTINEGGTGDGLISNVAMWERCQIDDSNCDLCEYLYADFNMTDFASVATLVDLAVGYFDSMCIMYSETRVRAIRDPDSATSAAPGDRGDALPD